MSSLASVLEPLGLQDFEGAFTAEGFENAADILELSEGDVRALAKDLGLGRGHSVRLLRWFKEGSPPAAAVEPSRSPDLDASSVEAPSAHASGHTCSVAHDGEEPRAAFLWCSKCAWLCQDCTGVHKTHGPLFPGHALSREPPPRPFWEDLNYEKDNESKEVLTVDFKDPRLVKRDVKNWRRRLAAATDEHVPVVSFVGPTGSGKSFLLTSLMAPAERKANGPTVSAPGQHVPESGNVFVFDSNPIGSFSRALLVDFEGEDGDVPKSLLRRIGKYANKKVGGVSQGLGKAVGGMVQMGGQMVSKVTKAPSKLLEKKGAADGAFPPSPPGPTTSAPPSPTLAPLDPLALPSSLRKNESGSGRSGDGNLPGQGPGSRGGLIGALEQLGDEWNYELWSTNRRDTVNTVLPVLAYLLSDVIVFVDTVEPRRLQAFFERVQEFATTAWAGCQASGWQPALVMVQNKWHYSEEDPNVDITDQFGAHVDRDRTLATIFTAVHFLRIPHSSYADALTAAHGVLAATVAGAAAAVHARRKAAGTLYSEKDWWLLAPQLAEEYSRSREPVSLPRLQLRALRPAADDRGVDTLFLLMDSVTRAASVALGADRLFEETKRRTLDLYRLAVALQLRRRGHAPNGPFGADHEALARERYQLATRVVEQYRCCAATFPLRSAGAPEGSRPHRCTQLRRGHEAFHRHPRLMEVGFEAGSFGAWFGWTRKVPMQWRGDFAMPDGLSQGSRENDFVRGLREVCALPTDDALFWRYVTAVQELGVLSLPTTPSSPSPTWHRHTCLRCLAPVGTGILRRLSECGHFCCGACLEEGRRAAAAASLISCPFCAVDSKWSSSAAALVPPGTGPRVLCLDGGGVRGLVEITILKHLCRLSGGHGVTDLFDVIGGTSTGGILSIAFGAMRLSPEAAHDMYVALTGRIFARRGISKVLPDLVSIAMGHPIFTNDALQDGLESAFGGKHKTFGDFPLLPKFFVTAFDVIANTTAVFGNFDLDQKRSEEAAKGTAVARTSSHVTLVKAAMASSAAPMYFPPITIDDDIFADGGMDANCPVVEALAVADSLFPGESLELLVSLGAGSVGPAAELVPSPAELESAEAAAAAAALVAAKRVEVEGRGAEWIAHLVSLQMEASRMWNQVKAHQGDDAKAAMLRLNPPEIGAIDPFHAHRCAEIVALTEAALQEPGMAAELCAAAGRLRAKLYFLSTDVAKEGTAIQAVAGGIVRFQVHERSVARPAALPRARVRRFEARAVAVSTALKTFTAAEAHLPALSSVLKRHAKSRNGRGSPDDGDGPGLWEAAGECCEYTSEALAGGVDFRFRNVPTAGPAVMVTLAVEVCLVEAAVSGGETRNPISGCPKFITFEVSSAPELPATATEGAAGAAAEM